MPVTESAEVDPNIIKLTEFEPATLDEITGIVKSYGVKCSPEDPVPAALLSSSVDTFAPFWLEILSSLFARWQHGGYGKWSSITFD